MFSRVSIIISLWLLVFPALAQEDDIICPTGDYQTGAYSLEVISSNIRRDVLVYVPESYDSTQPTALVISFHGFASNPEDQTIITGWNDLADEHGFIVVYPRGMGFPARWNSGDFPLIGGRNSADDVTFTQDIIAAMQQTYCIDAVYPNGYSNGGGMSNRLACELSAEVTAFGGVAGAYSALETDCNPEHPMPVIAFHGLEDQVVNFDGADDLGFPSVLTWLAEWADRNVCDPEPEVTEISDEITKIAYLNCEADVVLYTVADGGHTWPGGQIVGSGGGVGYVTQDINASELMWEFFNN